MTTAILALIGALVGYWVNELRHRREIGVKLIEIALGILAGKPEENKPLRDWAVEVLAHYSREVKVPLSEEAKNALRTERLPVFVDAVGRASLGRLYARGAGAEGESGERSETPLPLRESARERKD